MSGLNWEQPFEPEFVPFPTPEAKNCVSEFEQFWQAYPKKIKRFEAERAFVEVHAQEHLPAILRALEWQSKSPEWAEAGGKYIPGPERWLRDGRWHDEPPAGAIPSFDFGVRTFPFDGPGPQLEDVQKRFPYMDYTRALQFFQHTRKEFLAKKERYERENLH